MMDANFTSAVKRIVAMLVVGNYEELARITNEVRLDAESIERAVHEYGRKLVMPPSEAFDELDAIQIMNQVPCKWSVRMDLWTREEGRSDLSLDLTLIQYGDNYSVEVNDIHVL